MFLVKNPLWPSFSLVIMKSISVLKDGKLRMKMWLGF